MQRSFALRLRGFISNSSVEASIGFFVTSRPAGVRPQTQTGNSGGHSQPLQNEANRCLTIRSSNE